jgi:hypothetical protein
VADPTIEVDDGTSKDARMRTLEEGTSVNALLEGTSKATPSGAGAG